MYRYSWRLKGARPTSARLKGQLDTRLRLVRGWAGDTERGIIDTRWNLYMAESNILRGFPLSLV